jgi:ferrous iron transport protein B
MAVIALAGQANGGKTSLFNQLTGSRYKTVNYPGATVDCAIGSLKLPGYDVTVLDTPGILSLVPRSEDERAAVQALSHTARLLPGHEVPDLVVAVVDMSQPERALGLVRQLKASGFHLLVVLTMPDLAARKHCSLDPVRLSDALNLPVAVINGRTGEGLHALKSVLAGLLEDGTSPGGIELPRSISESEIRSNYEWAEKVVAHSLVRSEGELIRGFDPDKYLLDPRFGFVVFLLVMTGLFWAIFAVAAPLQGGVEASLSWLGQVVSGAMPAGFLAEIVSQGVIPGFQAVLSFVPQIAILFLLLGILEDSGFLARGTVIVDRPLAMIGLNGRSFVPLLSGFACAIPAIMAARTIPGRKERLLTQFVIPLMSCSARLPVFGLLLGLMFPGQAWKAGIGMTCIYLASLVLGGLVSALLARVIPIPENQAGFQIELPAWRLPMWKTTVSSTLERTWSYIQRAGGTIFLISIVFWVLNRFPTPEHSLALSAGKMLEPLFAPMGWDWRIAVGLLAAFAAREVFVSALAVVFAVQGGDEATGKLMQVMHAATHAGTNLPLFTISSVAALMVWFLIAMQCMATTAVFKKESGSWTYPLLQMVGYLGLGWVAAFATVQGLHLFGVP